MTHIHLFIYFLATKVWSWHFSLDISTRHLWWVNSAENERRCILVKMHSAGNVQFFRRGQGLYDTMYFFFHWWRYEMWFKLLRLLDSIKQITASISIFFVCNIFNIFLVDCLCSFIIIKIRNSSFGTSVYPLITAHKRSSQ